MAGKIEFNVESVERIERLNKLLLTEAHNALGGCVVYNATVALDHILVYEVDDPKRAIDWLVEHEIVDPTRDLYELEIPDEI